MKVPTEIPTIIFIDTQIFDSIQYHFKGGSAKGFLSAISDHEITLLLPDPTRREIERHIRELSSRAIQSMKLAQKTNSCLRMLEGWPLTSSKPDSLKAALAAQIQSDWRKFLKQFTVEELDYSGVSLSEVMNWRDVLAPPFSESKPSEYPDAFTISILRYYSRTKNVRVAVISGDKDFKKACEANDSLIYFENLAEYSRALYKAKAKKLEALENAIELVRPMILETLAETFESLSFVVEANYEGEVDDIELYDISAVQLELVEIDDGVATVNFQGPAQFSANVSYGDLDSATYDGGEVAMIHHTYSGRVIEETFLSGSLQLKLSDDEADILSIGNVDLDQSTISIEEVPNEYD